MSGKHYYHFEDGREYIPAYIWWILGFILILLFLVSMLLIYVLIKTKFLHIYVINGRMKKKNTSLPENVEAVNASSQTSEKQSVRRYNLDRNNSDAINGDENYHTLKRQDSTITVKSDLNTLHAPKQTDGSGNISPKMLRAIKDMPIINPEQMSEICKEVLKRRNGVEDTKSSLKNIDELLTKGTPEVKVEMKYASTPDLDVYDVLPTTTRSIETSSTEIKQISETNEKPSNNKSLNDNPEANCDVYDFPKESTSNALEVSDIYDSPMSAKMPVKFGYVIPYFSSKNLSLAFKEVGDKPKYALIQEISSDQSAINTQSEVKIENNVKEEEYYVNPKKLHDEEQMYLNANEVTIPNNVL